MIIQIRIEEAVKEGHVLITSPDLPTLILGGWQNNPDHLDKVRADIPAVAKILFKHNHNLDVEEVTIQ